MQQYQNNYIDDFVDFIKYKNNFSDEKARKILSTGWNSFGEGGFASVNFRNYTEFISEVFFWKHNDLEENVHKTYQFHAIMDFFRMVSYPIVTGERDLDIYNEFTNFLVNQSNKFGNVVVVDYGYGLSHFPFRLSLLLKEKKIDIKLVLVDVDRYIVKEFMKFISKKYDINCEFIDVTKENPFPTLPEFDFIQVKDTFEHIYHPENIVDNINKNIRDNGIVVATTDDEREGMMHVTPNLKDVRDKFKEYGFENVGYAWANRCYVYQK